MKKDPQQIVLARELRLNQTEAEKALWARLRAGQVGGVKFRRQQCIGPYIVDFVCLERKLVIDIDGGQHQETAARDSLRTRWLEDRGYRVVRFWNSDVMRHISSVLEQVREALGAGFHPHPHPLPSRERG